MPEPFCQAGAPTPLASEFVRAVKARDAAQVRALLERHPDLRAAIDAPWFDFDSPAIVHARDRALIDVLLDHGADIDARSSWWAGGFRAVDTDDAEAVAYLISRGARVDAYAAARLGDADRLRSLLAGDRGGADLAGGDGQRPLHVARDPAIIDLLLDHGADIDARDVDHEATPAQYQVDRPVNCRRLLERGATPDIFMACALGDPGLARRVLDAEPDALSTRVGACPHTRMRDERAGGHIYIWKLKGAKTPLEVCTRLGHLELARALSERSPPTARLVFACQQTDEERVASLLASHPGLSARLQPADEQALCDAAWEGRLEAARLMLDAGFDPHVSNAERMTPLHCAAFHGDRPLVNLLLARDAHPPLEETNVYGGTVLATLMHGAVHGWRKDTDYPGAAEALLEAGSVCKSEWLPSGHAALNAVLRRYAR